MPAEADLGRFSSAAAERAAFCLAVLLFAASLLTRAVHWDWLLDTAFLAGAGYLVLHPTPLSPTSGMAGQRNLPVLLAAYLLLDSLFMLLAALTAPGWPVLAAAVYTGCYAVSAQARLLRAGYTMQRSLGALLHGSALRLTLAAAVPLACLFLPMLYAHYDFKAWSGPSLVFLPGTMHMDAGRTLHLRGDVLVRGIDVAFSRVTGLLLLGALAGHLAHLQGWLAWQAVQQYLRWAAVLVALWWLTLAHGLRSLRQPADLLFAAGVGVLLATVFRRGIAPPA